MKGWSGRGKLAKINIYSRGTVYFVHWVNVAFFLLLIVIDPIREKAPAIAVAGVLTGTVSAFVGARLLRRAMDAYLGQGEVRRALLVAGGALAAVNSGLGLTVAMTGVVDQRDEGLVYLVAGGLIPFLLAHCLLVPVRTTIRVQGALLTGITGLLALAGLPGSTLVGVFLAAAFMTGWMAFSVVASMWGLKVVGELRDARDVRARLAVAEERLRFGRDLHDVLGRNLAVVALKSELAVQLARRGRAEAVDQMVAVQQIAQDSQREVREVVRGYREADLRVELEGARSVLGAAGINCTVIADEVDELLPAPARSALGWVVREATTNVLRHGDPRRCTISLGVVDGTVVLVVENDHADAPSLRPDSGGSGLAGLRERLAAVGGNLEAGPVRGGRFRVTARVPAEAPEAPKAPVRGSRSAGPVPEPRCAGGDAGDGDAVADEGPRPGDPVPDGEVRNEDAVLDGASRPVGVAGARGEGVA
ncbi:histidine kinase [Streptomyces qinzhouensis]|uniref:Sensor histidine kinase n=1 Tax=Streptomyces qinzhouensis TaxID=2599401 RepID=A0A5B8JCQ8_9ACTN|nr:histidine kinase [Streptomyces qinzhouensis]QDY77701.1 sensor histidine kinase [Streptomyces qinzhouensis]